MASKTYILELNMFFKVIEYYIFLGQKCISYYYTLLFLNQWTDEAGLGAFHLKPNSDLTKGTIGWAIRGYNVFCTYKVKWKPLFTARFFWSRYYVI